MHTYSAIAVTNEGTQDEFAATEELVEDKMQVVNEEGTV